MRIAADEYPETATSAAPVLSIDGGAVTASVRLTTHSHPEPKLMCSQTATLAATVGGRDWIVPPGYGLWVPGGVPHSGTVLRPGAGAIITFDPSRCPVAWTTPAAVRIGPLLREVIAHLQDADPDDPSRSPAESLLFALLEPLPAHGIDAPMPDDPRARTVAERLIADPADDRTLADWADEVHAGVRTLSRAFVRETDLTFAVWRTQVRVRAAARLLASGASVKATARSVGYRKTSAFIAAFRRATGSTPGTYARLGVDEAPPTLP